MIEAESERVELLRLAGEEWIRGGRQTFIVPLREGTRRIEIIVRLIDTSAAVPVRVDIGGLRVTPVTQSGDRD